MTTESLIRRLRKLEAKRRPGAGTLFVAWAATEAEMATIVADAGPSVQADHLAIAPWPYADTPPRPRWTTAEGLSDRELDALIVHLRSVQGEPDGPPPSTAAMVAMPDGELARIAFGGMRP